MSESKTAASPVERLLVDFQAARVELGKIETARNASMARWADMRRDLQKNVGQVLLVRNFEHECVVLRELNERYVEGQRRIHEIDWAMRQGHAQWSKERSLELSRSHAT